MSTDFKRLFANLEFNPERGSGSTYALVYQAIGAAMRGEGGGHSVIVYPPVYGCTHILRTVMDIVQKLGGHLTDATHPYRSIGFCIQGGTPLRILLVRSTDYAMYQSIAGTMPVFYDEPTWGTNET